MRIVMTLLAVAGNFAATVTLMLTLSTAANIGLTSPASAIPECDPRHYYCFPCNPGVIQTACKRGGCCGGTITSSGYRPD